MTKDKSTEGILIKMKSNWKKTIPIIAYSILLVYILLMLFEKLLQPSIGIILLYIAISWLLLCLFLYFIYVKPSHRSKATSRMASIRNPFDPYELFIQIFPVVGALGFTFEGPRIISSTQAVIKYTDFHFKNLDVFVLLTWALLSFWIYVIFRFTKKVETKNILRLEEVIASVQKLPSKNLMPHYGIFYEKLIETIRTNKLTSNTNDPVILVKAIQFIVGQMIEVVKYFSPYDDNAEKIAGNVMILINTNESLEIANFLFDKLSFRADDSLKELLGILVMPNELIYQPDTENTYLAPLYLPVPTKAEEDGTIRALPGAPKAALNGVSWYNNVGDMDMDLSSMSKRVRDKITNYFKTGDGSFIKSFISIRISNNPDKPIGVINFDSRRESILQDPETMPTLLALLKPLSMLLVPYIEKFAKIYVEDIKKDAQSQTESPSN